MRNKTANIYTEWRPLIDSLSNEDAGLILKFILAYQDGEDIDYNNPVWSFVKSKLDVYNGKYEDIRKINSEKGKKSAEARRLKKLQPNLTAVNSGQPSSTDPTIKQNKTKQNNIYVENIKFSPINKDFIDDVFKFKKIVESVNSLPSKPNYDNWATALRLLFKDVGEKKYLYALNWYAKNIGKQYIPECFSAVTFRDKWDKIKSAIQRGNS